LYSGLNTVFIQSSSRETKQVQNISRNLSVVKKQRLWN